MTYNHEPLQVQQKKEITHITALYGVDSQQLMDWADKNGVSHTRARNHARAMEALFRNPKELPEVELQAAIAYENGERPWRIAKRLGIDDHFTISRMHRMMHDIEHTRQHRTLWALRNAPPAEPGATITVDLRKHMTAIFKNRKLRMDAAKELQVVRSSLEDALKKIDELESKLAVRQIRFRNGS